MYSGMVFTASGMLTKQTSVQHPFGNAADGFGRSGRPGMGSGLVRECSGGVWSGSVRVGSGLRVDTSRCD